MDLMQARMAVALALSTAAHAGFVWMLGDRLASSAAPAERAVSVSMVPAAPRAVLNSVAPPATAGVSPSPVQTIAPSRVPVVDEPDRRVVARAPERIEAIDARAVRALAPEKSLHAREPQMRRVAVVSSGKEPAPAGTGAGEARTKALAAELAAEPSERAPSGSEAAHRLAPAPPARAAVEAHAADPGAERAATTPAGQPGADRLARPASGNEPPAYPWSARVRGDQGRVVVSVWVSAEGTAERLAVLESSGHAALDSAAVEAVGRWRFEPARRAGSATASLLHVPVVFRLE